jgi:hypothetical protein
MIEMTTPGEDLYVGGIFQEDKIASFSPDKAHLVILLKRGDLEDNVMHYEIRLFDTSTVMHESDGVMLLGRDTSTNLPALEQVRWADNDTLTFIGRGPEEGSTVFSMDIYSRMLKPLAQSDRNIYAYAFDGQKKVVAFLAQQWHHNALTREEQREGIIVKTQSLFGLLTGQYHFERDYFSDLYVRSLITGKETQIKPLGSVVAWQPFALSPDGMHLVVETYISHVIPSLWKQYLDPTLQSQFNAARQNNAQVFIGEYQLIDLRSLESRPLLNSPIPLGSHPDILWSPDSKSVAMAGILLPLDSSNQVPEEIRRRTKFVAEESVASGQITPISTEAVHLVEWQRGTDRLFARKGRWDAGSVDAGTAVMFSRANGEWVGNNTDARSNPDVPLSITLEQGMNEPPRIIALDTQTGRHHIVLDLNPQFKRLAFGKVEDLGPINDRGIPVNVGIYLPVRYVSGKKYPLIIQTHGWDPEQFWVDGPFTTASAAQAFAGQGFVVAQIAQDRNNKETLQNVQAEAANYDKLIDLLVRRGVVDESRIGIIGFSITALGVKYALTHSKYHLAAATIADPSDVGYFHYIASANSSPIDGSDSETINGGVPVGDGLKKWMTTGLDFGVEKTTTPLRLEVNGPESLLYTWETFTILQRLNRPVDLILIPDGDHVLVKPWNRLASQGGNVDWFRFWLQGYEDPDPKKADQYRRWQTLCDLQKAEHGNLPTECIGSRR